jgi:excisionase family DNA binding protein
MKNTISQRALYTQLESGIMRLQSMNKTAKEELLTAKEACAYLKVVPRTLYRHIRKHQIPALKLGREWRFIKSELDKWLMKRLQESSAESK